ncbi:MAG TPA: CoA transferase [Ramlibacter sp.]|nr:CoA transferase [Ramlibacter sp.]
MDSQKIDVTHALSGLRVLDLSGPLGNYAGKLFADLGADVVLVEPPGGSALRHQGPYLDDLPGLETSLAFAYHNTSKRGITLDLEDRADQARLRQLVAKADLLIETGKPGAMAARGLGYEVLAQLRPSLVMLSITPFGQTGPYADFEAEDIVALALGGMLSLGGYPDTAPMRVHGDQAIMCANMYGAVAAMIAVSQAELTGQGENIDVSMQEAVVLGMENAIQFYDLEHTVRKRWAGDQRFAGTGVYACSDGYVFLMAGGIGANRFWGRTIQWFADEGMAGVEELRAPRWQEVDFLQSAEAKRLFNELFAPWAAQRTKASLYHGGQARQIPIAPVNTPADIIESPQLRSRGHFVELAKAIGGRTLRMPGAPYKLSATPWQIQRPAPRLGQHNIEIWSEAASAAPEISKELSL